MTLPQFLLLWLILSIPLALMLGKTIKQADSRG